MDADRKLINRLLDALEKLLIESGAPIWNTPAAAGPTGI
jgi:hypothetical protein